ncbi:hypothetical protein Bca101_020149 [Brassica carinata]
MSCRSTRSLSNRSTSSPEIDVIYDLSIDMELSALIDRSSRASIDTVDAKGELRGGSTSTSKAPLPDFPIMPDIPMRDHGDFKRFVADALQTIWSRVSRCRCMSRSCVRARDPAAPGPSHQYRRDSSADDEEAVEDSD